MEWELEKHRNPYWTDIKLNKLLNKVDNQNRKRSTEDRKSETEFVIWDETTDYLGQEDLYEEELDNDSQVLGARFHSYLLFLSTRNVSSPVNYDKENDFQVTKFCCDNYR